MTFAGIVATWGLPALPWRCCWSPGADVLTVQPSPHGLGVAQRDTWRPAAPRSLTWAMTARQAASWKRSREQYTHAPKFSFKNKDRARLTRQNMTTCRRDVSQKRVITHVLQ